MHILFAFDSADSCEQGCQKGWKSSFKDVESCVRVFHCCVCLSVDAGFPLAHWERGPGVGSDGDGGRHGGILFCLESHKQLVLCAQPECSWCAGATMDIFLDLVFDSVYLDALTYPAAVCCLQVFIPSVALKMTRPVHSAATSTKQNCTPRMCCAVF